MIRILHTADWHLGAELAGWSRADEQARAFDALIDVVALHDADALIVAGDVFDHQNPSIEAQKLLFDLIEQLSIRQPRLTTVLVAGNHDAALRIDAWRGLFARANTHAIGALTRIGGVLDPGPHLVPLRDRAGDIAAVVLAVPFLRPIDLPPIGSKNDLDPTAAPPGGDATAAVRAVHAELIAAARTRYGAAPLVATGHLNVLGGALSESPSERRLLIGGAEAFPGDIYPPGLAYVALGHLHRAQSMSSAGGVVLRYAGSLLPLSAVERGYQHGVTLVEIAASGLVSASHIPLPRPAPMLRVPATGHLGVEAIDQALLALGLDPALPNDRRPLVEIGVRLDRPAALLRAEVERITAGYPLRELPPDIEHPPGTADNVATSAPLRRLAEHDHEELFVSAFQDCHGVEPAAAHLAAFRAALESARS